jgi:hypothetical protein
MPTNRRTSKVPVVLMSAPWPTSSVHGNVHLVHRIERTRHMIHQEAGHTRRTCRTDNEGATHRLGTWCQIQHRHGVFEIVATTHHMTTLPEQHCR